MGISLTSAKDIMTLLGGGGLIGLVGIAVALTRYFTKMGEQGQRDALARDKHDLERKLSTTEAQRDQLLDQLVLAGKAGSLAVSRKAKIDSELQALRKSLGASGASLYVPIRNPQGETTGLAFLAIEPFTHQTQQLRTKIIPLRSLAGRAFASGEHIVETNVAQSGDHFRAADTIANYRTATTLSYVIKADGEPVGVMQLLSKEGEAGFTKAHVEQIKGMPSCAAISEELTSLVRSGDYIALLGINEDSTEPVGTILYFDLSNSSALLKELPARFALQLLNEYFEAMCGVALAAGATIDNYMGDGALLRFNIPRKVPDHELAAVTAAMEMNRRFEDMRGYWGDIAAPLATIHNRIGIASGPLVQATIGHSQAQHITVLGYPISVASALCDAGPRDRSSLLVSDDVYRAVERRVVASPLDLKPHPKARQLVSAAWEITAMR